MKERVLCAMSAALLTLLCACTSPNSRKESLNRPDAKETSSAPINRTMLMGRHGPLYFVRGRGTIKTTKQDCEVRGGEYFGFQNTLPRDMVNCFLPPPIVRLGGNPTNFGARQILGSVYDYLYKTAREEPGYGLYSYVLLPVYSSRAEHFLNGLFNTTSFVELNEISFVNLNIIYLPTRPYDLPSLIPKIADGSPPPTHLFAKQFYDYNAAQKLLAQICISPSKRAVKVCSTDLSRGPYLITFTRPVSSLSPVPPPYLFVDLSSVHQGAFGEFITAYKEQVKRTDYADLERIDNLRLRILSIILTAADWIGPVKGAIADTVRMAKEDTTDK